MLTRLHLKKLTVFPDADLEFANGLNLVAGENGTGKTHLLKAAYAAIHVCASRQKNGGSEEPTKAFLQKAIADKLLGVFKPDELGRLVRRQQGRNRCEVTCTFAGRNPLEFSFNSTSKKEVAIDKRLKKWLDKSPVYLPTRELLTIYPGFVSLYETTHLQFEETCRDTCVLLGAPLAKGPRETRIRELLIPIEEAMDGKVDLDSAGRFYLRSPSGNMEMHLVAEGLRKLAMLARLIATGQLVEKGYLFWDEPEANLNPKIIKTVASTILHLCQNGIQVFVATHSLFLMRELDILLQTPEFAETGRRFFGLHQTDNGVDVQQGDSVDDIGDIASLEEELTQSDRFLDRETNS
ncbi:MAG: AAA family ATPase, partial [Planctomycetota bacterium]|nr:AAA family ATPase [Planctomycetota bacterium]